jgi:hypothetical protein
VFVRQEFPDFARHHRCPTLSAANINRKAEFALFVGLQVQTNVVGLDRSAVALCSRDGTLELTRQ